MKRFSVLAALALTTAAALEVRADNLDVELVKKSGAILKHLREHNTRNVGVLKFRVAGSGDKSAYDAGLINANLANRLENALILGQNENDKKPIVGVTRNAGEVAATHAKAGLATAEARQELFKLDYPLAWGDAKVRVDAFLTGVVEPSADLRTAKVIIQAFDAKSAKENELPVIAIVSATMDTSIMADLGRAFTMTQRGGSLELQPIAPPPAPDPLAQMLDVEIRYDNAPLTLRNNPLRPGEKLIDEPKENQKVHLRLKNKTAKRLGVVLTVNGQNTALETQTNLQDSEYSKWILEPGKVYGIPGFFKEDGSGYSPFKVLSKDASRALELSLSSRGLIQISCWQEGAARKPEEKKPTDDIPAAPARESLRGSLPTSNATQTAEARQPLTLSQARLNLLKGFGEAQKKRGFLIGEDFKSHPVEVTTFDHAVPSAFMTIRYVSRD